MATTGVLEMLARADLEVHLDEIRRRYRPGAFEALAARDPEWRAALERAEQEVGELYDALREADLTHARWRHAVADLRRLWARLGEVAPEAGADEGALDRVA
jgi:hypothetical protein